MLATTVRHQVRASAGTPVRWRANRALPTPLPTVCALRREGTHRRSGQSSGPLEGGARARPSRRATSSDAHGARRPLPSRCRNLRLHTDSCQTHPLWRHACATRSTAIKYAAARSETCSLSARLIHESSLTSTSRDPSSNSTALITACIRPNVCVAQRAAVDAISIGPMNADATSGRRGGRCRCREGSARSRPTFQEVDRCDSRLRHRPDKGGRPTSGSSRAT